MADDDRDGKDAPSLEPPSLSLRRRRRRKAAPAEPPAPTDAVPATPAETPPERPVDAVGAREAHPVTAAPVAVGEPASAVTSSREDATPPPLYADEVADEVARDDSDDSDDSDTVLEGSPAAAVERRPRRKVTVPGPLAAALTGLVVGLLTVGLTIAALRGCEEIRGTSSCGGSGLFLLLAILTAMVLVGSAMLRLFRVPEPGSTSFLAVGLLTVVTLLILVDQLEQWWMVIVIPLVTMATYLVSHWVTTAVVDPPRD